MALAARGAAEPGSAPYTAAAFPPSGRAGAPAAPEHLKTDEGLHVGELGGGVTGTLGLTVGPLLEQEPRPRPEVNTGQPPGWLCSRSCRGEVGLAGWRQEGGQSFGIARPRQRPALGGKLELLLEAGEAAAGRALLPRPGRPCSGRRGLTFGTLSHFLLVAYPPLPAKPVAAWVRDGGWGWGAAQEGDSTKCPHIQPLPALET